MIIAAADGSSLANPGPTGWAWFIDEDNWSAGGWSEGTNNQGELTAVLELLRATAGVDVLHVLCDSQYVIKSITEWLPGWKRRGWRKADGKPVLNVELMQALDRELTNRKVSFEWVKGHAGHDLNERVDDLARAAATAYRDGFTVADGPGFTMDVGEPDRKDAGFGGVVSSQQASGPHKANMDAEPDLFSFDDEPTPGERVVYLERSLLTDAVRSDPVEIAALLHPDFLEIGVSGRVWNRSEMLVEVGPLPGDLDVEILGVDELPGPALLVRYRTVTDAGAALRSSLWLLTNDRWRLRFHQATLES